MILAGDIGGTNTRLALFQTRDPILRPTVERTYRSREHRGLREIVSIFVAEHPCVIEHASFGIAGPVIDGRVKTSNLPWVIDARDLAQELGLESTGLLNDLEANAYGVAVLGADDFAVLNAGALHATGNAAVISAGTGLGEAGLYWDGKRHRPFAAEGGHAEFAPRNETEIDLLRYLLRFYQHVSYERVLSGPGLENIYAFLRDTGRATGNPAIAVQMRSADPAAVITGAGRDGRCALCAQALELFVSVYGAAAGNLALKLMATGGVYIGGGIAPQILEKLQSPRFMDAFTAKGRLEPLCAAIPVRVILNPKTALLGAARYASLQASS